MKTLDIDSDDEGLLSPRGLILTALTAAVLGAVLVAMAVSILDGETGARVQVRKSLSTVATSAAWPSRGSPMVYVVGSAEDAAGLAQMLDARQWSHAATAAAAGQRPLVVVETAADASAGRLFDFTFLDQSSAGARVSVVDLRGSQ